jgi:hypothetical protein
LVAAFALALSPLACGEKFTSADEEPSSGSGGMSSAGKAGGGKGGSPEGGLGGSVSAGSESGGVGGDVAASGGPPLGGSPPLGGNAGAGGGPLLPKVPPEGLELWVAADSGVTEEGGVVSGWQDASAHQRNALQTAVNYRPQFAEDALAGYPGLVFDGLDDHLKLPALPADFSGGLSIFMLMQQEVSTVCDGFFEASNGSEVEEFHLGDWNDMLQYEVEIDYVNQTELLLGQPQLIAVVHQAGGLVQLRRNSHGVGEGEFALPSQVTRQQFFIGRTLYDGCQPFNGSIGEIILYSRAVSDEELLDVEGYLKQKWGCCE